MRVKLQAATPADAADIAALRGATAHHLTSVHSSGPWSGTVSDKGVLFEMRRGRVYILRRRKKLIATLTLSTRKPWAIDRKYFSKCQRPLYLTSMAVTPDLQRQGIGRACMDAARKLVKDWPGDVICLDAYAAAGAGEFYRKYGFREVGRASYRSAPLIYFELFV